MYSLSLSLYLSLQFPPEPSSTRRFVFAEGRYGSLFRMGLPRIPLLPVLIRTRFFSCSDVFTNVMRLIGLAFD
jgi:hypothetical protein